MKKMTSLLLALLLAASCLTGCTAQAAEEFYDAVDQLTQTEDAAIQVSVPYHGGSLVIDGFLCRSVETASFTFTLDGVGDAGGLWTELRIEGNQLWLNVGQIAQRTLAFDLSQVWALDIQDLESQQSAGWVSYTWQGDLWSGIPQWGDLLSGIWEELKPQLNSHISGGEGDYTLTLSDRDYGRVLEELYGQLSGQGDSFQSGFQSWLSPEEDILGALQMDAAAYFATLWTWQDKLEALDSGESESGSLTLQLTQDESGFSLNWTTSEGDHSATITPMDVPQAPEAPESTMELAEYRDAFYYLLTFSNTYIGDTLDGGAASEEESETGDTQDAGETQEENEELFSHSDEALVEAGDQVTDIATQPASGYEDLEYIQFLNASGTPQTLPIVGSYTSNAVSSENDAGELISDLSLSGDGWYQNIYTETGDGSAPAQFLDSYIRSYYDAYVDISGYLLVEDLSQQNTGSNGALTQGFSYQEDEYRSPSAQIFILLPQDGQDGYIVIDLVVDLEQTSQADKTAVQHLFESLGLTCPVSLDA